MSPRIVGVMVAIPCGVAAFAAAQERVLEDWKTWPSSRATASAATAERGHDGGLTVRAQQSGSRAGILLRPEQAVWNLEGFQEVAVSARNLGDQPVRIMLRVDDAASSKLPDERHMRGICVVKIAPGLPATWLRVMLGDRRQREKPFEAPFVGMMSQPPDLVPGVVSETGVTGVSLTLLESGETQRVVAVGPLVARGTALHNKKTGEGLPFIDSYGQYIHRKWPDKIHGDADLARHREEEKTDLAAHSRPGDWNQYGGWLKGPQRQVTGFFRAEKIDGVWWMIDPAGRLFWSHGVVRVGTRVRVGSIYRGTPILDRENYFQLPARDGLFGQFYDTEPQATRGYYVGKEDHAVYDFLEANLFRKYGPDWPAAYAAQAQQRLASWGLNTIANSSDPAIYKQRKTPYTAIVYSAPLGRSEFRIQGSSGVWGKVPDPFDPGWRQLMERTLRTELKDSIRDPWCLGFFVDNELHWGDASYLAESTLASPVEQPAKVQFIASLQKTYASIQTLNSAWGTTHASWQALLAATTPPDRSRPLARADLEAFSESVFDAYFRGCRDAVKAAAPNHLYLGCRFAGSNALVMRAAARYCDVVSINRYARTIEDLRLPEGIERPIVIGEFSFGALDRGQFNPNNVPVLDQTERGNSYRRYVESALRNPAVIGTHWFQFYDQPTSGRFCGENRQHGLMDIADTPYPETIAAIREIGARLYQTRSAAVAPSMRKSSTSTRPTP